LETIRTRHQDQSGTTLANLEKALDEIRIELKKLKESQKPVAAFVIPPIIDPEIGIIRNRSLKMIRPSEIK
jgi:hypothetical protein